MIPAMLTTEITLEALDGEHKNMTLDRMAKATVGAFNPTRDKWRIEDGVLYWQFTCNFSALMGWVLSQSVGEFFFNDSVVCPTCKRVNEVKP